MLSRKTYGRIVLGIIALMVVSLVGVSAYDRDAVKALPVVGRLPWRIVVGNTALRSEDRPVDYFLPEVAQATEQQPDLLFLGDSLSRYWRHDGKQAWDKHFADRNAYSLGVSGDRTQHLLYRLRSGALDQLRPRTIVLQIGTNNVNRNTPDEICEAIQTIAEEIGAKWPQARLLVVSIPPRELPRSREVLDRVRETNQKLSATLARRPNVAFINISERFLGPDGWINSSLFTEEGVHLSQAGYALVAESIESQL